MEIENRKGRGFLWELFAYTFFSTKTLLCKGHWSFFVSDMRNFFNWRKSRMQSADTLHIHTPWMVYEAINFLKKWVKKDMKIYEYGSGSSTLFFSNLAGNVISIEHYEAWYRTVNAYLQNHQIKNVEYHLLEPSPLNKADGSCADPAAYKSCFPEYKGFSFKNYVSSIDRYPDNNFDLVIIDGRSRSSCILHAIRKVKPRGILLVDNAERGYYVEPFPELFDNTKWETKTFIGHVPYNPPSSFDTTILFIKKEPPTA
jgi:hypothetical protein